MESLSVPSPGDESGRLVSVESPVGGERLPESPSRSGQGPGTGSLRHETSSRRPLVSGCIRRRRYDDHPGALGDGPGAGGSDGSGDRAADVPGLPLPEPGDFVVGGHDIRETSFAESAEEFRRNSGVFSAEWIAACRDDLAAATARVRPGHAFRRRAGRSPSSAIGARRSRRGRPRQAVDRIAADMAAFVDVRSRSTT